MKHGANRDMGMTQLCGNTGGVCCGPLERTEKTEVGGRRTDDGGQRTEDGGRRKGKRKWEIREGKGKIGKRKEVSPLRSEELRRAKDDAPVK